MNNNSNLAKVIFNALYDHEDLQELKDKRIIAQKEGFTLSTIAVIEWELDASLSALTEENTRLMELVKEFRDFASRQGWEHVLIQQADELLKGDEDE